MAQHDLIIRGGLIADGTGGDAFEGDVAISDGKIEAIGKLQGRGREEVGAKGLLITPGFVDIHTHYDGQATWTGELTPSSLHGVTTAIMGNCGVGFAPCRPEDHDKLIRLMEGVEDIPFPVLAEGLPWTWNSFPDYLDHLSGTAYEIDLGAQLPHAALRVFVMGERGVNREPANAADRDAMRRLTAEAITAGAFGISTSRSLNHRSADGSPIATLLAEEAELRALASGLADAGKGVFQCASDFRDAPAEIAMFRRMAEELAPVSLSLAQSDLAPDLWRYLLNEIEACAALGNPIRAQVAPRPVGVLLGLDLTLNPFSAHPAYQEIATLPLAERVAALQDPARRESLLSGEPASDNPFVKVMLRRFGKMFRMQEGFDYEPPPEASLEAIAVQRGTTPEAVALDTLLERGGQGLIYLPFLNYAEGSLDAISEMMQSPASLPGLSDGGAHVGMICDGSFTTTQLTHWTRGRTRGPRQRLESIIARQSQKTAAWMGLHDRGVLAPGYRADLNVIDMDRLKLHLPEVRRDLPAGGRRLYQRAEGFRLTLVAGTAVLRDDQLTGAKPGRLVRGPQAHPMSRIAAE
jgi:N-acyl-D-aspartate/D-glutamate deacylase